MKSLLLIDLAGIAAAVRSKDASRTRLFLREGEVLANEGRARPAANPVIPDLIRDPPSSRSNVGKKADAGSGPA
jgi:hypothetical protein